MCTRSAKPLITCILPASTQTGAQSHVTLSSGCGCIGGRRLGCAVHVCAGCNRAGASRCRVGALRAAATVPVLTSFLPPALHGVTDCCVALSRCCRGCGCIWAATCGRHSVWALLARFAKPLVTCFMPAISKGRANQLPASNSRSAGCASGVCCGGCCCQWAIGAAAAKPVLTSTLPPTICSSTKCRVALATCCGCARRCCHVGRCGCYNVRALNT